MKVLAELLRIKEFREEKAEMESARARLALDEATQAVDEAHRAREDYLAWRSQEELRLYADLCSRQVRLSDLDDVSLQVELMRQRVGEYDEEVSQAEEAREAAIERRTEAQNAHREATRKREKFAELGRLAEVDWLVELARAEDLEMEEVPRRAVEDNPTDEAPAMEAQA